jgi:hypothetical protein
MPTEAQSNVHKNNLQIKNFQEEYQLLGCDAPLSCRRSPTFCRNVLLPQILSSRLLSKNLKVRTFMMITLPVVLYGCETWSPTLREEHRLRVFENTVLRRIFGLKRDEVTGEW